MDATRYNQESPYVVALIAKLEGVVYQGERGLVEFRATVYDDRGPKSAESVFGADFAITAAISDDAQRVDKGILFQAKLGAVDEMNATKRLALQRQLRDMKRIAPAPKILEIIENEGHRTPRVLSGNRFLSGSPTIREELSDYFVRRVLTTLDGKTGLGYVALLEDSRLTKLRVAAEIRPAERRLRRPTNG